MSVINTVYFALALLVAQVLLAAMLVFVFLRMRIVERDTRLSEEEGKTPILEVTGGGRIGRSRWSMRPLCRLSLYDDFLVVAAKAQRIMLPYTDIETAALEVNNKRKIVHILGPEEDGRHTPDILFDPKDPEALAAALNEKLSNVQR